MTTDYTGTTQRTVTNGPFGENYATTGNPDYTGYANSTWDTENVGDQFGAREYIKTHGRWLTPDPAGLAAVDMTNPQTWNRYAYVNNNPVSFADPTGLTDCIDGHYGCNCDQLTGGCGNDFYGPGNPGNGCDPSDASCGGGPGGGGFGGGGPGGGGPGLGGPTNGGGTPPSGGGTPPWQEWGSLPPWLTGGLPGFNPGCDFGVCNPIGNGFLGAGISSAVAPVDPLLAFLNSIFGITTYRLIFTGQGFPGGPYSLNDTRQTIYCQSKPWCQNTNNPFGMQNFTRITGGNCPAGQVWNCTADWTVIPWSPGDHYFFNYQCELAPSVQWSPMENCTQGP